MASVVVGAFVVVGDAVVDGSRSVLELASAVASPTEASGSDAVVVVDVVDSVDGSAIRASASETLSARIAEATRPETVVVVGASDSAAPSPSTGEVENAAKPITATSAMISIPAYARGIRGLTFLRGLAVGCAPAHSGLRPPRAVS